MGLWAILGVLAILGSGNGSDPTKKPIPIKVKANHKSKHLMIKSMILVMK
jgi:hypothetical protein